MNPKYGTREWWLKEIEGTKQVRIFENKIVPEQEDLHLFFPVADFPASSRLEMLKNLAGVAKVWRRMHINVPNVIVLESLMERQRPRFRRMELWQAYTDWQVGLALFVDLKEQQTFRDTIDLMFELENLGWGVESSSDDGTLRWREFLCRRSDNTDPEANKLVVRVRPHDASTNCRLVPTGQREIREEMKYVCDE